MEMLRDFPEQGRRRAHLQAGLLGPTQYCVQSPVYLCSGPILSLHLEGTAPLLCASLPSQLLPDPCVPAWLTSFSPFN